MTYKELIDKLETLEGRIAVLEAHRVPPAVRYIPVIVNPLEKTWPGVEDKTGRLQ